MLVLTTGGTVDETALVFLYLYHASQQFTTIGTLFSLRTHAVLDANLICTSDRLALMLMETGVAIKHPSTRVTPFGSGSLLSFRFLVVRTVILHTAWTVFGVVVAGVLTLIVVRFHATSAEITRTKETR